MLNLVVASGVLKSPALRYDQNSKPEFRFTLEQADGSFTLYLPCTASGAAAERLASQLEDGQHVVITSGKLCYRKRTTKAGEQSRLEILVWSADVLAASPGAETSPGDVDDSASVAVALPVEPASMPAPKKARRPSRTRASMLQWAPGQDN